MSARDASGIVYLVGAGPGDPGLVTVRAAALLARADVIVYDALANPALLNYRTQAEAVFVGKRSANHALPQAQINELLIERARRGLMVVRLKGGDPFVFGRGGEEAEALRAAGVRFEIVPGITAAIAASAYAGIPITHRDFNSSITFVTGHEREETSADASTLDWPTLAKLPCLAFYMGITSLDSICKNLIGHGMDRTTPAATIQWGTTPMQRTVSGTIDDLAELVKQANIGSPAITIFGRVVTLRESLGWFESRPLFGKTIAVTRTRQQMSELSEKLSALGAAVIEAPTIEIYPPADWRAIDAAMHSIDQNFDWVVFTSANGVSAARDRLKTLERDARIFGRAKIAAIGTATAEAIERDLCLRVDCVPPRFTAEALADELQNQREIAGKRFLLLRADIARPVLRERLQAGGARKVVDLPIYETRKVDSLPESLLAALDEQRVDCITFTSSSTAANFFELLDVRLREKLSKTKIASIGPITSQTLRLLGFAPTTEAATYTIDGLLEAILQSRD